MITGEAKEEGKGREWDMLIERSESAGERREEWNGREKRTRRGEGEKVHVCEGEREQEKVRGRERENAREYSSVEWGLRGAREVVQRWRRSRRQCVERREPEADQKKRTDASIHWSPSGPSGDARGKIKKKKKKRAPDTRDEEGGSDIGSSEVVNGGRGRCEKSPRKKCARDEAKQRAGPARVRGWRGIYERREIAGDDPTGALFLSFLRPSDYRCVSITSFFFFPFAIATRRASDARISRDVDERVGSEQIRVPPSGSPRGWRDCAYIFQDIGNILRDVARSVRIVQIDINTAYAWLSEFPGSACWSNWQLKITFLSCLNSFRTTNLRAIALMYVRAPLFIRIDTQHNFAIFERQNWVISLNNSHNI